MRLSENEREGCYKIETERESVREREKKRLQEWHHSARLRERARETERDERHPETARMREREID